MRCVEAAGLVAEASASTPTAVLLGAGGVELEGVRTTANGRVVVAGGVTTERTGTDGCVDVARSVAKESLVSGGGVKARLRYWRKGRTLQWLCFEGRSYSLKVLPRQWPYFRQPCLERVPQRR